MASTTLLHRRRLLPTALLFLSTILNFPTTTTPQECPYPCYPPPTGPGNNPPVTTSPPASTTPPAPIYTTTPPAGFYPFTPPPPYFYGLTPPPPEPIVPWFPYYFRKPPHGDQSSSTSTRGSQTIITIFPILYFVILYFI